ncbi:hypothetical protein WJX73_010493, partial [Symbiochloris irregularis]
WTDMATGEPRIGLFALKNIGADEELTYDYKFQHLGLAHAARAYKCLCGAPNCRGTMDVRPDRTQDLGKRVEVFWEGDEVYYRGTVVGYFAKTHQHQILYDDNDVEKVNLSNVAHRWLDEDAAIKQTPTHPSSPIDMPTPQALQQAAGVEEMQADAELADALVDSAQKGNRQAQRVKGRAGSGGLPPAGPRSHRASGGVAAQLPAPPSGPVPAEYQAPLLTLQKLWQVAAKHPDRQQRSRRACPLSSSLETWRCLTEDNLQSSFHRPQTPLLKVAHQRSRSFQQEDRAAQKRPRLESIKIKLVQAEGGRQGPIMASRPSGAPQQPAAELSHGQVSSMAPADSQAVSGASQPPTCLPIRSLSLGIGGGTALNLPRASSGADRQVQLHAPAAIKHLANGHAKPEAMDGQSAALENSRRPEGAMSLQMTTAQAQQAGMLPAISPEAFNYLMWQEQQQQQQQGTSTPEGQAALGQALMIREMQAAAWMHQQALQQSQGSNGLRAELAAGEGLGAFSIQQRNWSAK